METIPPEPIKTDVADELYKEHEIKEEMAIGPVVLQGGSVESSGGANNKPTNTPDCTSSVSVKQEPEDAIVKSKHEGAVSFVEKEVPDLYEGHEVKEEMVIGPVVLQKASLVDAPTQACPNTNICKKSDRNLHDVTIASSHNMEHDLNTQESQQPLKTKDIMPCKVYSNEFKTKMTVQQREVVQSDNGFPYVCDYCQKGYRLKPSLIYHIGEHTGEPKFECHICKEKFLYRRNLNIHLETHVEAKPHVCEICSKSFPLLCNLKVHLWTHISITDEYVCCEICRKRLKRSNLLNHYKIHTGEKPFKCDICDKRFTIKHSLDRHQMRHTCVEEFSCSICDMRFREEQELQNHQMKMKHTGVKQFSCDICDKQFRNKKSLDYHQKIHTGVRPFACDNCDKQFYRKSRFLDHQKVHTGVKPFGCDICDKRFYSKRTLKDHHATHSGVERHSCNICDKQFTKKSSVQSHMQIHSGIKPFRCEICNKCFGRKRYLRIHQQTYADDKSCKSRR